jgi:hypothetical protein
MSDLSELTKRVDLLESKLGNSVPKVKRTRKPSEYNIFMGKYLEKNKDPKKTHKELFGEAVAAWNKQQKK